MSNSDSHPPDLRRDRSKDRSNRSGPQEVPRWLPGPEEGGYVDLASIVTVNADAPSAVPAITRVSIREADTSDRSHPNTRAPRRRTRDKPPPAATAPDTSDRPDTDPAPDTTDRDTLQPELALLPNEPSSGRRIVVLQREPPADTRRIAGGQHQETASADEHRGRRIPRVSSLLAGAVCVTLLVTLALVVTNVLEGGSRPGRPLGAATRPAHVDTALLAGGDPRASERPVAPVSLHIRAGALKTGAAAANARDLLRRRHPHPVRHHASPAATSQPEASSASTSLPASSTSAETTPTQVTSESTTTPSYTPSPSSGGSSSGGGGSASSGSNTSSGSSSTSKSGSTPAFGSGGVLGPGSSPDS